VNERRKLFRVVVVVAAVEVRRSSFVPFRSFSFLRSFVHSFIRSFLPSFLPSFVPSLLPLSSKFLNVRRLLVEFCCVCLSVVRGRVRGGPQWSPRTPVVEAHALEFSNTDARRVCVLAWSDLDVEVEVLRWGMYLGTGAFWGFLRIDVPLPSCQ